MASLRPRVNFGGLTTRVTLALLACLACLVLVVLYLVSLSPTPQAQIAAARAGCHKNGAVPLAYYMHGGAPTDRKIMCVYKDQEGQ